MAAGTLDSVEERARACTFCHGAQDRSAPDGYYPRLAGKPAGYLLNQLRNFREGRRQYAPMVRLVDTLSDAYLAEFARYFASLEPQHRPPRTHLLDRATAVLGERLVREGDAARGIPACSRCHGERLTGVLPFIPGLLGLPPDYVNAQLGAWRTGLRKAHAPDCMSRIAGRLSTREISAISAWLSAQPVSNAARPAAALDSPLPIECGSAAGTAIATQP